MTETDTEAVKTAVERLKALPGQDLEALGMLLDYARGLHADARGMRAALVEARVYTLMRTCSCEGLRKCDRCRLLAEIGKVLG